MPFKCIVLHFNDETFDSDQPYSAYGLHGYSEPRQTL